MDPNLVVNIWALAKIRKFETINSKDASTVTLHPFGWLVCPVMLTRHLLDGRCRMNPKQLFTSIVKQGVSHQCTESGALPLFFTLMNRFSHFHKRQKYQMHFFEYVLWFLCVWKTVKVDKNGKISNLGDSNRIINVWLNNVLVRIV